MYLDERFFRSTRGRIVVLLRRASRRVDELARELGLTDNAVRAHLAALERDGVVRQGGTVRRGRGAGKPAHVYELTPEAEGMFSRAYEPVLSRLLDVLVEKMGREGEEELLREAGVRVAADFGVFSGSVRERLEAAVGALNELGGFAELVEEEGSFLIRGHGCPLSGVVSGHPEACRLAEALVSGLAGVKVHERCERGGSPRCRFEVVPGEAGGG